MHEMQFPLNKSGPARLADPQPLRLQKNKDTHMPENTHVLSAVCVCVLSLRQRFGGDTHSLYVAAHFKAV